jgi:hypothetical protein
MRQQVRRSQSFAGLRAKCYALRVALDAEDLKKLNVRSYSFTEPASYTRPIYGNRGLIMDITKTVNSIIRSFMKDKCCE